jgi:GrpB-like predicted nucleotidyltransferase (UPF0157 family)
VSNLDEPIHLSKYDPQWPILFRAEAGRLSVSLPADLAIEHIGSTAVPGLIAKPIVDIMVGTQAHHDLDAVRSALVYLGYDDMSEAGVPGRIYLRRRSPTAFNIALVERGGPLWLSNLAFRNHLQRSPEARNEYARIKIEAVESGIRSLLKYSDFKGAIVSRLILRATESEQR